MRANHLCIAADASVRVIATSDGMAGDTFNVAFLGDSDKERAAFLV
jgi:hypothetical protein